MLPEMAADLNVSVSHAGLLITAFAVGMIVGGPTMAMATLRLPQRHTLIGALAVFALRAGRTARSTFGGTATTCPEPLTVLVHVAAPAPRLLIFGAIDFAAALSQAGRFLGYRVTVCAARPVFATSARFPHADEVVVDWPHRYLDSTTVDERTAICVLTHDPKFDIPLLRQALTLPVGYVGNVGAMGSRRTHEERLRLLREAGVEGQQLAALRSPIGLDLGARTPEERPCPSPPRSSPTPTGRAACRCRWAPAPSTVPLRLGYFPPQAP